MSVLALLLAGPLQAWGSAARFARRTTDNAPTKSGVLGLLAAAQGRPRSADLDDLAALRFAVRVDQPGVRVRDFQTAHHADTDAAMPISERFYLSDAVFVAAVSGGEELIDALHRAVRQPHFLPYLGRRSCPPSRPVDIDVFPGDDPLAILREVPWHAAERVQRRWGKPTVSLDALADASPGEREADTQRDVPISFDPLHRRYGLRGVCSTRVTVANPAVPRHDPMAALGGH